MISYDKYRYFVCRLLFGWPWIPFEMIIMIAFHFETIGLFNVIQCCCVYFIGFLYGKQRPSGNKTRHHNGSNVRESPTPRRPARSFWTSRPVKHNLCAHGPAAGHPKELLAVVKTPVSLAFFVIPDVLWKPQAEVQRFVKTASPSAIQVVWRNI